MGDGVRAARDAARRESVRLKKEVERVEAEKKELQGRVDAQCVTVKEEDAVVKEMETVRRDCEVLRGDNGRLVDANKELQRETVGLRHDVERLEGVITGLQHRLDEATHERSTIRTQLSALETTHSALQENRNTLAADLKTLQSTHATLRDGLQRSKTRDEKRQVEFQTADALSQWMAKELERKCLALEVMEKTVTTLREKSETLRVNAVSPVVEDPEKSALQRELQLLRTQSTDAQHMAERKLATAVKEVDCLKQGNTIARGHIKKIKEQLDACQADRGRKKMQIAELERRVEVLLAERVEQEVKVEKLDEVSVAVTVGPLSAPELRSQRACPPDSKMNCPLATSSNAVPMNSPPTTSSNTVPLNSPPTTTSNAVPVNCSKMRNVQPSPPPPRIPILTTEIHHVIAGSLAGDKSSNAVPVNFSNIRNMPPPPPQRIPILTTEIHHVIAGFLAGDNAYGSLANYNIANRAMHQCTLPVLYETVVWDNDAVDFGSYGIRDPDAPERKLPVGWSFTRHLFCSGLHRERLHDCIFQSAVNGKIRPVGMHSINIAFPHVRMALLWQMQKLNAGNASLVDYRCASLQLRGPMDVASFHRLFTSLRLRYWPDANQGSMQFGPISGITDIKIFGGTRFTGPSALDPAHRFFNYTDRRLAVASQLPETNEGRRVLHEVLRLVGRPNPADHTWREHCPVELQLGQIRPLAFRTLVDTLYHILPSAPQDLRVSVQLAKPNKKQKLTVDMVQKEFRYAVDMFTRIWPCLPVERRSSTHSSPESPPFFFRFSAAFAATSGKQLRFEGTIFPTCAFGRTFTADLKAFNQNGSAVFLAGSQYPIVSPRGMY